MQIIKLHLGLVKYLIQELPKKKTPKEVVNFLHLLTKSYFKELLRLYKNVFLVFDKDYQAKKKEYDKYQKAKKEITGLIKLLRYSKERLRKAGVSRQRIKRFFISLGSSDDSALQILCDDLMKEVN
jgi:cyclophilin family peptidyl-prolyl cis-trans isomerase